MKYVEILGLILGMFISLAAGAETPRDVLAGTWVSQSGSCDSGDVFILRPDGTFETEDSEGTWTLTGEMVIIRSRPTGSPKPFDIFSERISRIGAGQVTLSRPDGSSDVWTSCAKQARGAAYYSAPAVAPATPQPAKTDALPPLSESDLLGEWGESSCNGLHYALSARGALETAGSQGNWSLHGKTLILSWKSNGKFVIRSGTISQLPEDRLRFTSEEGSNSIWIKCPDISARNRKSEIAANSPTIEHSRPSSSIASGPSKSDVPGQPNSNAAQNTDKAPTSINKIETFFIFGIPSYFLVVAITMLFSRKSISQATDLTILRSIVTAAVCLVAIFLSNRFEIYLSITI